MPVARSTNKSFRLGDYEFCHYHAEDTHGTVCDTYYVDGYLVHADEFYRILREEVQDGKSYIARALGLIYAP